MDKTLTTIGGTGIKNKFYPEKLRQWEDYAIKQPALFEEVFECFHPPETPAEGCFKSRQFLQELSEDIGQRRLANERDAAKAIINALAKLPYAEEKFRIQERVVFNSRPNPISDIAGEVAERLRFQTPASSPVISEDDSRS